MGSATKSASACEAPEGVSNAVEAPTTSHRTQERKSWTLDALPAMALVRRSEVSNILRGEKPRIDSIPLNSPISKLRPSRMISRVFRKIQYNPVQYMTVQRVRPQSGEGESRPETGCLTRITTNYSLESFEVAPPAFSVQMGDTASESRPQIRSTAATALPYAPEPRTDLTCTWSPESQAVGRDVTALGRWHMYCTCTYRTVQERHNFGRSNRSSCSANFLPTEP